mgnify:CR=1 FL=1
MMSIKKPPESRDPDWSDWINYAAKCSLAELMRPAAAKPSRRHAEMLDALRGWRDLGALKFKHILAAGGAPWAMMEWLQDVVANYPELNTEKVPESGSVLEWLFFQTIRELAIALDCNAAKKDRCLALAQASFFCGVAHAEKTFSSSQADRRVDRPASADDPDYRGEAAKDRNEKIRAAHARLKKGGCRNATTRVAIDFGKTPRTIQRILRHGKTAT